MIGTSLILSECGKAVFRAEWGDAAVEEGGNVMSEKRVVFFFDCSTISLMEVEFDGNPIVEKLCAVKTKHEEEANTVAIVEIINVVLGNSGQ